MCARTVNAGDNIEVLKQHLPDGWSLVSAAGQVGLLPESYYAVSGDRPSSPLYLPNDLLVVLLQLHGIRVRIWRLLMHPAPSSLRTTLRILTGPYDVVVWWCYRIHGTACYS